MNSSKSSLTIKSFQELQGLLKKRSFSLAKHPKSCVTNRDPQPSPASEENLFMEEMEGVAPISRENCVEKIFQNDLTPSLGKTEDTETLEKLRNLVEYGEGFNVAATPEYIEGTGYHVHPEIAKRLHRGDFSIQAHLDLHGLIVEEAKEIFDQFIKWAVTRGKTGILVTHGRGLSSPAEPVLKKKVEEWLTRGSWRKWVVAYSSARRCDGGAGATYVLLRVRPVTKRFKVRKTSGQKS